MDSPYVYTTIIGRHTQHAIQGIVRTYHLLLKFSTSFRIGVIEGVQTLRRESYQIATMFQSKQLQYATHTFPISPAASLKLVEVYD